MDALVGAYDDEGEGSQSSSVRAAIRPLVHVSCSAISPAPAQPHAGACPLPAAHGLRGWRVGSSGQGAPGLRGSGVGGVVVSPCVARVPTCYCRSSSVGKGLKAHAQAAAQRPRASSTALAVLAAPEVGSLAAAGVSTPMISTDAKVVAYNPKYEALWAPEQVRCALSPAVSCDARSSALRTWWTRCSALKRN